MKTLSLVLSFLVIMGIVACSSGKNVEVIEVEKEVVVTVPAPEDDTEYVYVKMTCARFHWYPKCLNKGAKGFVNKVGNISVQQMLDDGWEVDHIDLEPAPGHQDIFIHPNPIKDNEAMRVSRLVREYDESVLIDSDKFGSWYITFKKPNLAPYLTK